MYRNGSHWVHLTYCNGWRGWHGTVVRYCTIHDTIPSPGRVATTPPRAATTTMQRTVNQPQRPQQKPTLLTNTSVRYFTFPGWRCTPCPRPFRTSLQVAAATCVGCSAGDRAAFAATARCSCCCCCCTCRWCCSSSCWCCCWYGLKDCCCC